MSGPFVASKVPFEEAKRAKQDVGKEAPKGELKASAQDGERGSGSDAAKESAPKEGQQAAKEYADSNLFAAAGLNVPSRPPPLSKSAQVSHSPVLHPVQPAYLMSSLRIMNPQYGIQQNIRVVPSAGSPSAFSSSQLASGGEIELPQARIERVETREAGNTSSVASSVPADASAAATVSTTVSATTASATTASAATASAATVASTSIAASKNTQEDTSSPKLNDAAMSSMDDAVENGEVQTQQGGSESSEGANAQNKTVQMSDENEGGKSIDTSTHAASSSANSPNQRDREVAARDTSVQKSIDEPREGPSAAKDVAQTKNESAAIADSVNMESGANASGSDLTTESKTINSNPPIATLETPSANARTITPTLGANPATPPATAITNPTITIASTSTTATPPATASANTTATSTSDASTLETRIGAAIAAGKDSASPAERRLPAYDLDNEIDDVVELLDPLSSFSITPSGPASPEHPGSNLQTEGINMDPLNDIEDGEFARNELGQVSSDKQKKIPRNEGGGIVFSDCNVDIHTLNNYSSSSNMSEVGYYLRSILKELREFQKLMTRNSALEERLSSVERTLNALVHREDKD